VIVKHGGERWVEKIGSLKDLEKTVELILKGEHEEFQGVPFSYSDYHGVGELETPYFMIQIGTFPVLTEKKAM
jgi:hypothetical protein